jgi:hypothetical protein
MRYKAITRCGTRCPFIAICRNSFLGTRDLTFKGRFLRFKCLPVPASAHLIGLELNLRDLTGHQASEPVGGPARGRACEQA